MRFLTGVEPCRADLLLPLRHAHLARDQLAHLMREGRTLAGDSCVVRLALWLLPSIGNELSCISRLRHLRLPPRLWNF